MDENVSLSLEKSVLSMVMEALPIGGWIMDESGKIVYGNPAGQRIWAGAKYVGPEHFGEYIGWWADSGKLIEPHEWAAARAIEKGEVSVDEVIDIQCFDGSRKTILNSGMPIRNPEGTIVGAIIVNQDISEKRQLEKDREKLILGLEHALAQVKTLSGLLPICASCKNIRDDKGAWNPIETYILERTNTEFSHGICPDCLKRLYPDFLEKITPDE